MRIALIAAGFAALTLAACNSPEDKAAEQQAGNADGGATTANTPGTTPPAN